MKSIKRTYCCFFVICVTLSLLTSCDKISKLSENYNNCIGGKEVVKPTQPEIINNNDLKRWVYKSVAEQEEEGLFVTHHYWILLEQSFKTYFESQFGKLNDDEIERIDREFPYIGIGHVLAKDSIISFEEWSNEIGTNYENKIRVKKLYNTYISWNNTIPSMINVVKYDKLKSDENIYEKYEIIYSMHYGDSNDLDNIRYANVIVSVFNNDGHWEGNLIQKGKTINEVDYNINNNNNN